MFFAFQVTATPQPKQQPPPKANFLTLAMDKGKAEGKLDSGTAEKITKHANTAAASISREKEARHQQSQDSRSSQNLQMRDSFADNSRQNSFDLMEPVSEGGCNGCSGNRGCCGGGSMSMEELVKFIEYESEHPNEFGGNGSEALPAEFQSIMADLYSLKKSKEEIAKQEAKSKENKEPPKPIKSAKESIINGVSTFKLSATQGKGIPPIPRPEKNKISKLSQKGGLLANSPATPEGGIKITSLYKNPATKIIKMQKIDSGSTSPAEQRGILSLFSSGSYQTKPKKADVAPALPPRKAGTRVSSKALSVHKNLRNDKRPPSKPTYAAERAKLLKNLKKQRKEEKNLIAIRQQEQKARLKNKKEVETASASELKKAVDAKSRENELKKTGLLEKGSRKPAREEAQKKDLAKGRRATEDEKPAPETKNRKESGKTPKTEEKLINAAKAAKKAQTGEKAREEMRLQKETRQTKEAPLKKETPAEKTESQRKDSAKTRRSIAFSIPIKKGEKKKKNGSSQKRGDGKYRRDGGKYSKAA